MNINKCNIRTANLNDIEQIVPLLIKLDNYHVMMYPNVFDASKIKEDIRKSFLLHHINTSNNLILLAECENTIVGVLHCYIQETKNHPIKVDNIVAILSDLFVDENYRNKGFANQLIQTALTTIKNDWLINDVLLNVFNGNESAIKLYEKIGFQQQFSRYTITI